LTEIFEPFAQGAAQGDGGGLGLGLTIVKGIVELHAGTVTATSDGPGRGAEFTIRLPRIPEAARPGAAYPAPLPRQSGARRCVLVVDDNSDAAESLADLVRLLGHDAEVARDGAEALAVARTRRHDVIFCDLGLPRLSGFEVARALRAERGASVRLIAVSGYAQAEDRRAAAAAGFDRHLAKPPDPVQIESELLLDRDGARQTGRT
jgi:CheY-like chemotaxis protein